MHKVPENVCFKVVEAPVDEVEDKKSKNSEDDNETPEIQSNILLIDSVFSTSKG